MLGPTTCEELRQPLGVSAADMDQALETLEAQGVVLRGQFRPAGLKPGPTGTDVGLGFSRADDRMV